MTIRHTISMPCRAAVLAVGLLVAVCGLIGATVSQQQKPYEKATPMPAQVQFKAVEIWLDSGDQPLAAWQIEFKPAEAFAQRVKIVGIEGGAPAAFANPPYYDPQAMQHERVIIAAYSTAKAGSLPAGRMRIATIHLQIDGNAEPEFTVTPMAIATVDGRAIDAQVDLN